MHFCCAWCFPIFVIQTGSYPVESQNRRHSESDFITLTPPKDGGFSKFDPVDFFDSSITRDDPMPPSNIQPLNSLHHNSSVLAFIQSSSAIMILMHFCCAWCFPIFVIQTGSYPVESQNRRHSESDFITLTPPKDGGFSKFDPVDFFDSSITRVGSESYVFSIGMSKLHIINTAQTVPEINPTNSKFFAKYGDSFLYHTYPITPPIIPSKIGEAYANLLVFFSSTPDLTSYAPNNAGFTKIPIRRGGGALF